MPDLNGQDRARMETACAEHGETGTFATPSDHAWHDYGFEAGYRAALADREDAQEDLDELIELVRVTLREPHEDGALKTGFAAFNFNRSVRRMESAAVRGVEASAASSKGKWPLRAVVGQTKGHTRAHTSTSGLRMTQ